MSAAPPAAPPAPAARVRRRAFDSVLLALTLGLLALSLFELLGILTTGALHGNDFKHLYAGARMLALGANPYDPRELMRFAVMSGWHDAAGNPIINPYVYLPTTGLLMRPLASLAYPVALAAWTWLNWAAAWLLVLAGPGLLRLRRRALARLVGAVFLAGAFPFYRQMTAGQMNVVTAWLVLGAAAALLRRRDGLAGALLGLGFAWKLAPALLILALWPMRRGRAALAGLGVAAGLWGASFAVTPPAVQFDALRIVSQMGYGHSTWAAFGRDYYRDPFNQSPNALLHHLLTANPHTQPWLAAPPAVANGLTILMSLILACLWLARRRRFLAADAPGELTLFFAASLAMLLLPSLMWDHYVVQALPALLWLAGDPRTARSWPRSLGLLAILGLFAWPWPHLAPINTRGAGILLMSLRLWPMLALYGWLLLDGPRLESEP